ncbi:MAG: hypothetical protein ACYDCK_07685 [Thermoplasmatota archaeon]
MNASEPGAFRLGLGLGCIGLGLAFAAISIGSAFYSRSAATSDSTSTGDSLFALPLAGGLIVVGLFIVVSGLEWRRHSPRVEPQDEAPHGLRPGF